MTNPLLVACADGDALAMALRSDADALVLDLGDPDAPGDRAARHRIAVDVLQDRHNLIEGSRTDVEWDAGPRRDRRSVMVRIASLASGLADADLDAVMAGRPDAVLLPGAVGAQDVQHLAAKLAVREAEHGLPDGVTRILAMAADSAAGVLALASLPGSSPRLLALGWDPAALAAGLGVDADASPVRAARDLLLIAAAAAGLPALDGGMARDDLAAACAAARHDGFSGRFARRPDEIAVIAAAFPPRRA